MALSVKMIGFAFQEKKRTKRRRDSLIKNTTFMHFDIIKYIDDAMITRFVKLQLLLCTT